MNILLEHFYCYKKLQEEFLERYSNEPDCVKRKLEVISQKLTPLRESLICLVTES